MTTNTTDRQLVWVVLVLLGALVVLPTLGMGFGMMGYGPMMGGMWGIADGTSSWMFVVGLGMQLLFLAVVVGGAYFGYRALTERGESRDQAVEELRRAYARGDLSDEEYEQRLARLESES